jgi:alkaline phosphatase D
MNPSDHAPKGGSPNRRDFLKVSIGAISLPVLLPAAEAAPVNQAGVPVPETIGPVLGHIDTHRICCFIRPKGEGPVHLIVKDEKGEVVARREGVASAGNDFCVRFEVGDLKPDSSYSGEFTGASDQPLFDGSSFQTRTLRLPESDPRVVIGMGSCVSSTSFDELWQQAGKQKIEAFCLLGDTPYIDSNKLAANREARRVFWGHLPALGSLAKRIPFWNTWDDHDFGKNDSDGLMPKKEEIRKAFLEYNALASYGEEDHGIYTSFRFGPLEVWLIDDRWFSQTEASWADPAQKTCIGPVQWQWLQRTLKASTAPFKILCTGMVWYPKGNAEKDHWETYSAEREAIFTFIKQEKIPGVVLVSGDIHVSRHHNYGPDRLGYPLHEWVISPMHASVIPSLDVPHTARIWSKPEPNVFLTVEADSRALQAKWINMGGDIIHEFKIAADELHA